MTLKNPLTGVAPLARTFGATDATVHVGQRAPEVLAGAERDELAALVLRLKQADERRRQTAKPLTHRPSVAALNWAEGWQLPREVHEYFVLETA